MLNFLDRRTRKANLWTLATGRAEIPYSSHGQGGVVAVIWTTGISLVRRLATRESAWKGVAGNRRNSVLQRHVISRCFAAEFGKCTLKLFQWKTQGESIVYFSTFNSCHCRKLSLQYKYHFKMFRTYMNSIHRQFYIQFSINVCIIHIRYNNCAIKTGQKYHGE